MWTGKLIGALAGFFVLGPIFGIFGALIGLGIGHMFDSRGNFSQGFGQSQNPETQKVFFETLFQLLGHISKADGHISPEEVAQTEAFMTQSRLTAEHRKQAIELFKEGSAPDFNLQARIHSFKTHCSRSPLLKQTLIMYLIGVALADGKLDPAEHRIIVEVASELGMNQATVDHLIRMVGAQSHFSSGGGQRQSANHANPKRELELAYEALGASPDLSDAELKKVYRRLMSENHPDKLIGQGLPKDMIEVATERSQEIQTAYELIRKHRKSSQ